VTYHPSVILLWPPERNWAVCRRQLVGFNPLLSHFSISILLSLSFQWQSSPATLHLIFTIHHHHSDPVFESRHGQDIFPFPERPHQLWGPPGLLSGDLSPGLKRLRRVATHLHLVPRMSGALPPSAYMPCGVYPDNTTFQRSSFQSTSYDLQPDKQINTNDTRVPELGISHGISWQMQSFHRTTLQRQRTYSGSTTTPSHNYGLYVA
jgi:hypothetical protein